jgi:hypothetical protein
MKPLSEIAPGLLGHSDPDPSSVESFKLQTNHGVFIISKLKIVV